MKTLIVAILLISGTVQAVPLEIVNHTGVPARIAMLHNKCDGFIIPREMPVYLKADEKVVLQVTPVIQGFDVCGSGMCVLSAMGMSNSPYYKIEIILDKDGWLDFKISPDDWGKPDMECP